MIQVKMVQTRDGELHETFEKAIRHAEVVYGESLTRLATKVVRIDKYTAMCDFIDENLEMFIKLDELKADIELQVETDEERENRNCYGR